MPHLDRVMAVPDQENNQASESHVLQKAIIMTQGNNLKQKLFHRQVSGSLKQSPQSRN